MRRQRGAHGPGDGYPQKHNGSVQRAVAKAVSIRGATKSQTRNEPTMLRPRSIMRRQWDCFPRGMTSDRIHDLAGNVWEWTGDWYGKNYYKKSPSENPAGPASELARVFRGGSWFS